MRATQFEDRGVSWPIPLAWYLQGYWVKVRFSLAQQWIDVQPHTAINLPAAIHIADHLHRKTEFYETSEEY